MARDFSRCTVFYSSLRHPVYVGSPGLRCVMDKRKLAVRFAKNWGHLIAVCKAVTLVYVGEDHTSVQVMPDETVFVLYRKVFVLGCTFVFIDTL